MPLPRQPDRAAHVDAILGSATAAAMPQTCMGAAVSAMPPAWQAGPLAVAAFGKAAASMADAIPKGVRERIRRAVVVVPAGTPAPRRPLSGAEVLEATHPIPTQRSVAAAEALFALAAECRGSGTPLLVLLSGGASSLVCAPEPGLAVEDISGITRALMLAGATIDELNTVRTHCDRVKGGGLAAAASPAPTHTLILSDVVSGGPEMVGSGPTLPCATTAIDALAILRGRRVQSVRSAVTSHLRFISGHPTPRPRPDHTSFAVIGDNRLALNAAAAKARELGFEVAEVTPGLGGEARESAFALVSAARRHRARLGVQPFAVLWGGETTVTVRGRGGRGGRNLEAALAAAITIDGDPTMNVATFATDGIDGTSDAAGVLVSGLTAAAARRAGADPEEYLSRNDSHGFFEKAGSAGGGGFLRPGPTGTNVNDVWVVLGY